MQPTLSVILPFFNAEKTLKIAVQSILEQSFSDFELILVNNNSTDCSIAIVLELQKSDNRIKLIHETKQGVAFAMNCGLKHSKGKFLARMDADDISLPTRFEKQINYLKNNPVTDLVGCYVEYQSKLENTKGFMRFVNWSNSFYTSEEISLNRFIEIPIINPTILFRRKLFEQLGACREGTFPEDYEMMLRYLDAGANFYKLPEKLLEWHDLHNRLTRTDSRYSSKAFYKIKAHYFFKWSIKNNPFHPTIWVWGAGQKTRQRARFLEGEGLKIIGYFDIKANKTTTKQCLHYGKILPPGQLFIVSMVAKYEARDFIKNYLQEIKYKEGIDYMMLA